MSWGAALSEETNEHRAGDPRPFPETAKAIFCSKASAGDMLLVDVAAPRPTARGRLALCVDGAIERALEARGAPPSAVANSDGRDATLKDQLRRARVSGVSGLSIWFSSLHSIAAPGGALDTEDSAVIRWWIEASTVAPVHVGFDAANAGLGVYLEPRTLESILAEAARSDEAPSSRVGERVDPDADASRRNEEPATIDAAGGNSAVFDVGTTVTELAPAPAEVGSDACDEPDLRDTPYDSTTGLAASARAMAAELEDDGDTGWLKGALLELSTPVPPRADPAPVFTPAVHGRSTTFDLPALAGMMDELSYQESPPMPRLELRFADPIEPALPALEQAELAKAVPADEPDVVAAATAASLVELAEPVELEVPEPKRLPRFEIDLETRRKLEACARELEAASGPKPLAVVERLFTNAYVPLRSALDRAADLPRLRDAADEWARSFERSYKEGFDALRVRTKRPSMVVDVGDIALRVGRLHGARSTQLLLVDGMRFDIGESVNDKIRALVGQRAACADRFLLWSALPATTSVQLDLIGRGPAGLRDMTPAIQEDLVVARGRKASMIRRLKAGNREVLKLDVVASRLEEPGGAEPEGFDAIADEVAQRVAGHFEGLQPRTLVLVFGDHGFALDTRTDGRTTLASGGAFPETVLVPAYAWLVGAVH